MAITGVDHKQSGHVGPLRSSRRRERGLSVVLAARVVFEQQGFRSPRSPTLPRERVSPLETIRKSFGTKAALAKAVFDVVIAGNDEPISIAERPAAQAIRDEPNVRVKIVMFV
jgi:hypothetical protein